MDPPLNALFCADYVMLSDGVIFYQKRLEVMPKILLAFLGCILFTSACLPDFKQSIDSSLDPSLVMEEAISKNSEIDLGKQSYSDVISALPVNSSQKISLIQIQSELTEEILLLKLQERKLTKLLTDEFLKSPYNRPKVEYIMKLYIKNSKSMAQEKLKAMLLAKNIIRHGLTAKQIENVSEARKVLSTL